MTPLNGLLMILQVSRLRSAIVSHGGVRYEDDRRENFHYMVPGTWLVVRGGVDSNASSHHVIRSLFVSVCLSLSRTHAGQRDPLEHLVQRLPDAAEAQNLAPPEARADDAPPVLVGRHERVLGLLPATGIQSNRLQLFKVSRRDAGSRSFHALCSALSVQETQSTARGINLVGFGPLFVRSLLCTFSLFSSSGFRVRSKQGASLIIIKGHRHLNECAYIKDDSSEEEDELEEIEREKKVRNGHLVVQRMVS